MNRAVAPPCLCGIAAAYAACCGRYHAGVLRLQAPSAEALMRSRYSAYVLLTSQSLRSGPQALPGLERPDAGRELTDYVLATWHPGTRPATLDADPPGLKWLGLEVRRHTMEDTTHATVEFIARSKRGGRAQRLHEISRFVLEGGRWFYLDGDLR